MLVQLLLDRSEDSKRKLFAPGLVVKNPEHSTDVTFIILLFTGERLIASRHDVIKVGGGGHLWFYLPWLWVVLSPESKFGYLGILDASQFIRQNI